MLVISAAERKSAITVELDFVDPGARPHRMDQHRFHRLRTLSAKAAFVVSEIRSDPPGIAQGH
jgi:hypothetical protein